MDLLIATGSRKRIMNVEKTQSRKQWRSLAEELCKTQDVQRSMELVIFLEEVIFNRQQELALNADKIAKRDIEEEEQALKGALELMLEVKVKKLGFPDIRQRNLRRKDFHRNPSDFGIKRTPQGQWQRF